MKVGGGFSAAKQLLEIAVERNDERLFVLILKHEPGLSDAQLRDVLGFTTNKRFRGYIKGLGIDVEGRNALTDDEKLFSGIIFLGCASIGVWFTIWFSWVITYEVRDPEDPEDNNLTPAGKAGLGVFTFLTGFLGLLFAALLFVFICKASEENCTVVSTDDVVARDLPEDDDDDLAIKARAEERQTRTLPFPEAIPIKIEDDTTVYDAFLTHNWGREAANHKRVAKINKELVRNGIKTWFDEERILNNMDQEISRGVDRSDVMVVFITKEYMTKVNTTKGIDHCRNEFQRAVQRIGPENMIPVVLDPDMTVTSKWEGLLALHLGNHLYVDMTTPEKIDSEMQRLVKAIKDRLKVSKKKERKK